MLVRPDYLRPHLRPRFAPQHWSPSLDLLPGQRRRPLRHRRIGALLVPDVGEVECLKRLLYQATADLTLKLYKTNVTPAEGDTHSSYTVADFTNYVNKTLTASQTGSTWAAPSTSTGTSSTTYAAQSWTCGASGNTVYGYWVQTADPILMWAELFATARTLASGDVLNLTPRLEAA